MHDLMALKSSLLDFPTEVLLDLCEVILPGDIENFAITCRQLYSVARRVLEHQRLEAAHSHISLIDNLPSEIFLKYCAQESRLSLYPKKFTIRSMSTWPAKKKDHETARKQIQRMATEKNGLFLSEKIVSLPDGLNDKEFDGAMCAIVARCLPNLEAISFEDDPTKSPSAGAFVKGITELTTHPINSLLFPRLSHFRIAGVPRERIVADLEPFLPILALPNLRSFETYHHCCSSFNSLPFPPRTSKVETLKMNLKRCSMHSMSTLLSAFDALKSFEVTFLCQIPVVIELPSTFHDSLLEHCRDSLQRLRIHNIKGDQTFFGSLRPFSVLKSVMIDWRLLFRDGDVIPRLVDLFPCSIQEIILTGFMNDMEERELFNGFLRGREGKVPNLHSVANLCRMRGSYRDLQQEGDYCFIYTKYDLGVVIMQVVDAAGQWKLVKPSSEFVRVRGVSLLPNEDF